MSAPDMELRRAPQEAPKIGGWYYGRYKGRREIMPIEVVNIGPRPLSVDWHRMYRSVTAFDWFGPVDQCKELYK